METRTTSSSFVCYVFALVLVVLVFALLHSILSSLSVTTLLWSLLPLLHPWFCLFDSFHPFPYFFTLTLRCICSLCSLKFFLVCCLFRSFFKCHYFKKEKSAIYYIIHSCIFSSTFKYANALSVLCLPGGWVDGVGEGSGLLMARGRNVTEWSQWV